MFDMETLYTPEGQPASTPKTPIAVVPTQPAPAKTTINPLRPAGVSEPAKPPPSPSREVPVPTVIADKHVPSPIHIETTAKVADKIPEIPAAAPPPIKPVPAIAREPAPLGTSIVEQLARITSLLEIQNKTLASQDKHIAELTKELDTLKNKVDARGSEENSRKDEIIRKLELELEEAKS